MFSMTNAAELRQRAEQSQQQQNNQHDQNTGASISEEKSAEHVETECDEETAGRNADPGDSHSEKKEQLPDDAIVGNSGVEDKHGTEYDQVVMSEEQVDEFFKLAIAKLTSAEEREAIKKKVTPEMRIPALLLEVQNDQLEAMGIGKLEGKEALNRYARTTAMENKDAHDKMDKFTQTCQRTYVELLRELQPGEAETEKKMTSAQIIEFFEACDTLMALQETRDTLRKEFLETKKPPDETIVGMQRKMLRTLGFDPDHGVSCLNTFPKDFPDDGRLQQRSQDFMRCATMARQEAMLGKEEMTKQMQMQQMSVMKQHKMAMELQALSEAGREELIKKVAEMQKKHAAAVMTLSTPAERAAYIRGIPEEEQWEIAKVHMLNMHAKGGSEGGHSHSHDHGHAQGHSHGHGHGHGHEQGHACQHSNEGEHQATNHSHDHEHST